MCRLFAESHLVFYGIDWTHEMMLGEVKREIERDMPDCMMVIALHNVGGRYDTSRQFREERA